MAYFGNYGGYGPQQMSQVSHLQMGAQAPTTAGTSTFASTGLASYGGAYKVNQPAYYAGPSYSTTSDNDYLNSLPMAGYGGSNYNYPSSYGANNYSTVGTYNNYPSVNNLGCYGGNSYANDQYLQQQQQQQQHQIQIHIQQQQQHQQQQQQQQQQQPSYSQNHQTSSFSQAQMQPSPSGVDELSQLAPQIEAAYEAATGQQRRQPVIKRQVITIPGAPGRVQQIVRRLPTPTPDIIERVFIVKPQRDVVNLIIERPGTPPAQYKDRTIMGKPRKPVINPLVVRVAARNQQVLQYQQQYQQCMPALGLNIQRTPPSTSYHYQSSQQQQPLQQQGSQVHLSQQQQQQPALSSQQYSQAQLSQAALSQTSQSQIQPQQVSQHQLTKSQLQKGFVIAPIQYDDATQYQQQQQQQQQQSIVQPQAMSMSSPINYPAAVSIVSQQGQAPASQAVTGYAAQPCNYYNATAAAAYTTPSLFGAGYSTGFPATQQFYPQTYSYQRVY